MTKDDDRDLLAEFGEFLDDGADLDEDLDWEGLALGDGFAELDDDAGPFDEIDLCDLELDRDARDRTRAARLAAEFGWARDGAAALEEVFGDHGIHGSTIEALRRQREAGLDPEDLSLAHAIRQVWAQNPQFSSEIRRSSVLNDHSFTRGRLGWSLAVALARHPVSRGDVCEAEQFLHAAYECWVEMDPLLRQHAFFETYVWDYIENVADASWWRFALSLPGGRSWSCSLAS